MEINVREIFENNAVQVKDSFIQRKGPDRNAAATRLAKTEELLESWHKEINSTNTRELSVSLSNSYQKAFEILVSICEQERRIVLGE